MTRRRRYHRYQHAREIHVDCDMETLTDDELESLVRICNAGMSIALAARHLCHNQPRSEKCR